MKYHEVYKWFFRDGALHSFGLQSSAIDCKTWLIKDTPGLSDTEWSQVLHFC
jgi:hypothetical protein